MTLSQMCSRGHSILTAQMENEDEGPEYLAIAFETVSRLYAGQLIPTFFVVVLISIYASFPFTLWQTSSTGLVVPEVSSWPQHVLVEGMLCLGFAAHAALCYACEPSHQDYALHMFGLNMGLFFVHPALLALLEAVGFPYRYYYLDWLTFLFAVLYNAWTMTVVEGMKANAVIKRTRTRQSLEAEATLEGRIQDQENIAHIMSDVEAKEVKDESFALILSGITQNLFCFCIFLAAPLLLIPVFRQSTTSDSVRIIVACFAMPVLIELLSTVMRLWKFQQHRVILKSANNVTKEVYRNGDYTELEQYLVPYVAEILLIMMRRFLIGAIQDPQYATIAILITGVEEAVLRCTLVDRDRFIRKWLYAEDEDDVSEEDRAAQHRVWAVSIMNTMQQEFIAIVLCRITYLVFRPHRFVFNFGYNGNIESGLVVVNMMLEIVGEALIDIVAAYTEIRQGIFLPIYFTLLDRAPLSFNACFTNIHFTIIIFQLWAFRASPSAFFCTNPTDACTCSGGGFDLYTPFCTSSTSGGGKINITSNGSNAPAANETVKIQNIKGEYVDPFEFMGDNLLTFIFGFLSMVSILAVLAVRLSHRCCFRSLCGLSSPCHCSDPELTF